MVGLQGRVSTVWTTARNFYSNVEYFELEALVYNTRFAKAAQ